MRDNLYLAFVWHMHQPFYKNLMTGRYLLPWVRLHAIKDYYDMAALIEDLPAKLTFNLVPSLLAQLEDYSNGQASDDFLELSQKPAADLTIAEKIQILKTFFYAHWETMIKPYPRYWELLNKRGRYVADKELAMIQRRFNTQDFLDLQVLFNLTWFGFEPRKRDEFLRLMIKKGSGFSEEDKVWLLAKQGEYLEKIIPLYKKLLAKGQIEITTTPYYHPILPLLCDLKIGQAALPEAEMPEEPFKHPIDARNQTQRALDYMEDCFGRRPSGMWPAEGSVSDEAVGIFAEQGVNWIATDEQILALSLGRTIGQGKAARGLAPAEIYKPYVIRKDGREITIIFRDRFLSDLIGFNYYKRPVREAVADFISNIRWIKNNLPEEGAGFLVTVILDGENAWEFYSDNGNDFLRSLYQALIDESGVEMTTVQNYLDYHPPLAELNKIWPGSWINANFGIWMGQEEDITGWDYLTKTRKVLDTVSKKSDRRDDEHFQEALSQAWEQLYIAEGSDWFWWFGDNFTSANDAEFDLLFRENLMNVYRLLGLEVPEYLQIPIKELVGIGRPTKEPVGLISPRLDGLVTDYYEWLEAGSYVAASRGPMYNPGRFLRGFYYGFDLEKFYFRLDPTENIVDGVADGLALEINIFNDEEFKIRIEYSQEQKRFLAVLWQKDDIGQWQKKQNLQDLAANKIIEVAVPFSALSLNRGARAQLVITVSSQDSSIEKLPPVGAVLLVVPREDYVAEVWHV